MEKIKNYLKSLYIKTNPKMYDLDHMGALSFWRSFFLNILRPGRIITRIRYKQIFKNKKKILKNFNANLDSINSKNAISESQKRKLLKAMNDLLVNGATVIDNYFSDETIETFLQDKQKTLNQIKKTSNNGESKYYKEVLELTDNVIKLWLDPYLTCLLNSYYGRQSYAARYPNFYFTEVSKNYKIKKTVSDLWPHSWHVDYPTNIIVFVLLQDLSESDVCMEVAPGTHKYFNSALNYSDETIANYSEPVKFFGKKGTIHIFLGNTIHRLRPVAGSQRVALRYEFTPGPNIFLNYDGISKCLSSGYKLNKLNHSEQKILEGIFPKYPQRGFELNGKSLVPNKYKGI